MSADEYKKRNLHEHILKLPDSYIGSKDTNEEHRWVYNPTTNQMAWTTVQMNPGLYKIFDEVLVNARDAYIRSVSEVDKTPVKHIDISFTRGEGGAVTIRVSNDGDGIPVGVNSSTGIWAPELIFGHLLTSNNYDEEGAEREKITGGKNGYGAKLANIFSKKFTVETVDTRAKKKYTQTWRDNMYVCEAPAIKNTIATKGFVAIEFEPDLARFPGGMSADMEAVLRTRVVEMAGLLGREVKITWNGEAAPANTFEKYVKLFLREGAVNMVYEQAGGPRWEIACVLTRQLCSEEEGLPDDKQISFVNGINTRKGGKHVETVTRHVMKEFCELAKKKKVDIAPGQLKDSVFYFVNATIVNPSFDSQSKETLTTPATKFGSKPVISEKFIQGLVKLGLLDEAAMLLEAKQARDAKKTDGKKRSTLRGIAKLTDAEWAGTAKSKECTLILTEGDSAATSAISGLLIVGRERWGVFPLRGKLLNVRDVSAKKMMENEEITAIKKIIGLEAGKVYTDTKELRYGRIMIMADQDHDGSHIKGLVMNLLHSEWPSLLKTDFVCSLMTPIIKATKGKEVLPFYSIPQFDAWKEQNSLHGWRVKYYKGLGTSTPDEAREWFKKLSEIKYEWDGQADDYLTLAFSKKRADDRKGWLGGYDPRRTIDVSVGHVPFSRFINDELIHFSNADNIRSLPSVMDGLKPSQRKILFGCMKRHLHEEVKVAQLAGYVSEHAAYHHGEASLNSTIVGMAQNFVGSNNINLLLPKGQFGSRLQGGKDASQPRYIFTRLMPIVETLFKKTDAPILRYLDDDGMMVEPDHYLPVVPLLAINGCSGIGTGFSTDIPSYNPAHIVALMKARLTDKLATLEGRALDPWWFGFKGRVTRKDDVTWLTHGVYTFNPDGKTVTITELPVGVWSQDYKEMLERMVIAEEEVEKGVKKAAKAAGGGAGGPDAASVASSGKGGKEVEPTGLQNFKESNNDIEVNITLTFTEDAYEEWRANTAAFEKKFKLTSSFKTTNMHAFSPAGAITKYATVGDILEAYYVPRLEAYARRKAVQLETMRAALVELEGRLLFVRGVLEERIVIARKEDTEIVAAIRAAGVPPISLPDEPDNIKAYEYVLKMRIDRIKAKAVVELEEDIAQSRADIDALEATTPSAIWLGELADFEAAWEKFSTDRAEQYDAAAAAAAVGGSAGKKKTMKAALAGRK